MELISDNLLREHNQANPTYDAVYKTPQGVDLADLQTYTKGQPFDFFRRLREEAPVAWIPYPGFQGFWALTSYEDIKYVDMHPQLFSSQRGGIQMMMHQPRNRIEKKFQAAAVNNLISMDQPYHIPLRMEHRPFFTPDYVKKLGIRVEEEVDRLLDIMEKLGPRLDLVELFSERIPLFTLCEMLGVEEKDRPKITRWMHDLEMAQYALQTGQLSPMFIFRLLNSVRQMFRYGKKVMKNRRKKPRDDLLTVIAHAKLDDKPMSQEYLDGAWLIMIFAGNDTTRNSISGTMRMLTLFPDQKQKVIDDPSLLPLMVQEALRIVSPVMYMRRTANEDTELSGQKIAKGEKVVMWFGAANRDPSIFENPDRMDMHRQDLDKHIAFGIGPHNCLGKRTAIMQLEASYKRILERFPNIYWTGIEKYAPTSIVSAITHLEVDLGTN